MPLEAKDLNTVQWKKAICGICPAGCWVEVGMENGKLVDIRQDLSLIHISEPTRRH